MDGGRVLRALLSGWMGRARATSDRRQRSAEFWPSVLASRFCVWTQNPIHIALAAFIYFAAQSGRGPGALRRAPAAVRRASGQGIWTAPPGYRWVSRGNGLWQLAPITVRVGDSNRTAASPWS